MELKGNNMDVNDTATADKKSAGSGGWFALIGKSVPTLSQSASNVNDILKAARLKTPDFQRRMSRYAKSTNEFTVSNNNIVPNIKAMKLNFQENDTEIKKENIIQQNKNLIGFSVHSIAQRSVPGVQLLSRARILIHSCDALDGEKLKLLLPAISMSGGSTKAITNFVTMINDSHVDQNFFSNIHSNKHTSLPISPSKGNISSALDIMTPLHLSSALSLPLSLTGSDVFYTSEVNKEKEIVSSFLSAEMLSTLTYFAYPADWWSPGLLMATAGVSQKLHTAVIHEWRMTIASQNAATSRALKTAYTQIRPETTKVGDLSTTMKINSSVSSTLPSNVPKMSLLHPSNAEKPTKITQSNLNTLNNLNHSNSTNNNNNIRSRIISVPSSATADIRADTWGRTSNTQDNISSSIVMNSFAARIAAKKANDRQLRNNDTLISSVSNGINSSLDNKVQLFSSSPYKDTNSQLNKTNSQVLLMNTEEKLESPMQNINAPASESKETNTIERRELRKRKRNAEVEIDTETQQNMSLKKKKIDNKDSFSPGYLSVLTGSDARIVASASPTLAENEKEKVKSDSQSGSNTATQSHDPIVVEAEASKNSITTADEDVQAAVVQSGWWWSAVLAEADKENSERIESLTTNIKEETTTKVSTSKVSSKIDTKVEFDTGDESKKVPLVPSIPKLPGWWPGITNVQHAHQNDNNLSMDATTNELKDTTLGGSVVASGTIDSNKGQFRAKYVNLAGGKAMQYFDAKDRRRDGDNTENLISNGLMGKNTINNTEVVSLPTNHVHPLPAPRAPTQLKPTEWDSAAEWTRRVVQWQHALLSAYSSVLMLQKLDEKSNLGTTGGSFLIRFSPSETTGNVIFVASYRWLLRNMKEKDSTIKNIFPTSSDAIFCIMFRSSRTLRQRLTEMGIAFTTPADPDLGTFDNLPTSSSVAAAAEDLSEILRDPEAVEALSRAGLSIENVQRLRALQQRPSMHKKVTEDSQSTSENTEFSIVKESDISNPVEGTTDNIVKNIRDKLRGTPTSHSSLLFFSGLASVSSLMQCLLESVCPTIPVASAARSSSFSMPAGKITIAPIPLSILATPTAGSVTSLRQAIGSTIFDVPQILSTSPFLHASLRRLAITTIKRQVLNEQKNIGHGIQIPNEKNYKSLELLISGGPILPGTIDRIMHIFSKILNNITTTQVLFEPHLATCANFGNQDITIENKNIILPSEVSTIFQPSTLTIVKK